MRRLPLAPLLLASTLALCACATTHSTDMLAADAARALPDDGRVAVAWADPAGFTEIRNSNNRFDAARGNWLTDLAQYLRKRSEAVLPAGERLQLTIVDIDRAGDYEPWRGLALQDTRIVRDLYPPRMTVQFQLFDASGKLLEEGERKLSDPAFLLGSSPINDSDPLRYEKRMIDSWVRREFADRTAAR
jgi:hypothetical protein